MDSLVDRCLRDAAQVVGKIGTSDNPGWAAPSPCAGWTVRQAGNHLIGSITVLARIAEGETLPPGELDPQLMANTERLGPDPADTIHELADRVAAAFADPRFLERRFDQPAPDVTGEVIATITLVESLVHGWDVATGAGVAYQPDSEVVKAVRAFVTVAVGDAQREQGLFGPAVPTPEPADPFVALLGHLGRRVG